ncbi:MAG TPA: aminoglycoside adenylyltransferase domain-containing protein, partial [Anaerolineales bacterium]
RLHVQMADRFGKWARRLECSYTPAAMLSSVAPPKEPRPYWGGEGTFYEAARYGNEWIINNYLLYQYGIALHGPEFRELTGPVQVEEVQKACIRDLFQEWEPKANDPGWFQNSHFASYFVLNLCRILHTVMSKDVSPKKTAAAWTKARYGEPWRSLIETAEDWRYGTELNIFDPAIAFLNFVVDEVSKTGLYRGLADEIGGLPRRSG